MKKPHIIIFNPDQWRGDVLGRLGNPAALTPNLDALVEKTQNTMEDCLARVPLVVKPPKDTPLRPSAV